MTRLVGVALALAAMLVPAEARAHAHLKRSAPADGARLEVSPATIRLWFSERPELAMSSAQLRDSTGKEYALGPAARQQSDALGIEFPVLMSLPSGAYTVTWRAAGSDGHPSHGKLAFVVIGAPTPRVTEVAPAPGLTEVTPAPRVSSGAEHADDAASPANSIARALSFACILALIGTVTFCVVVLPRAKGLDPGLRDNMMQRAAIAGMVAAAGVLLMVLARLYLESQMMKAMPDMPGMKGMDARTMVMQTAWGFALRLQVVTAALGFFAFALAARRIRWAWYLAAVAAIALAVTPALGGHAAASPRLVSQMIAADWLHVLGGSVWLGTLLSVVVIGIPTALSLEGNARWATVASLVNAFSPLALASAAVVAASGAFASWIHMEHLAALWNTGYGKTLLVKLALVAVTLGIGFYNFRSVQPKLSAEMGTRRLRRSAAAELATGLLILLVTGLLTGISP